MTSNGFGQLESWARGLGLTLRQAEGGGFVLRSPDDSKAMASLEEVSVELRARAVR